MREEDDAEPGAAEAEGLLGETGHAGVVGFYLVGGGGGELGLEEVLEGLVGYGVVGEWLGVGLLGVDVGRLVPVEGNVLAGGIERLVFD